MLAGEYDLSKEVIDVDGKSKLMLRDQTGREVGGLDTMLDYVTSALRLFPTDQMSVAVSNNVLAARLVDYKGTEKAAAAPLSNENIKSIKDAVLKAYNGFVLFRVMQVIDPAGLKE
jgi:hypothetical protein